MRIIQVNKYHFLKGGAERYYLDLSSLQRDSGRHIQHLVMQHPRNLGLTPEDQAVQEVDYRASLSLWQKLQHACKVVYNPETARAAEQLAQGERPAIAHLHNIYHQLSPSLVRVFAKAGIPMVQTLHDYKLICPGYLLMTEGAICERCKSKQFIHAFRHRCILGSAAASLVGSIEGYVHEWWKTYSLIDRFLCPSRFMLEKVAEFGIPRDKLIHLPYLLPVEQYEPADFPPEPACVYVGRLSREKGLPTLFRAMSLLPPSCELTLRVLGEGPIEEELRAFARAECPDRIEFLGYQSGAVLQEAIRKAAFAVLPSEWYENYPFGILEPFALGRPVVGAAIGGIPELVFNGETGRLFESGNPGSLAEALEWMTSPGADLEQMGKNARAFVARTCDPHGHLARLDEIYAGLTSNDNLVAR
ncbi:MAG: glycosyltransferase [Verrucomicrobiota bacterium]|nr:glycosyltransferase [Verrucomicrobiota bacterium]MDD8052029.1 glycosyltransferase [Verrucomicrobiota bacterium]